MARYSAASTAAARRAYLRRHARPTRHHHTHVDLNTLCLRPGHSKYVRATLNARMAVLGAQDLFQLVAMEAVYNHREPLIRDRWDPAIIGSGLTLPEGPHRHRAAAFGLG